MTRKMYIVGLRKKKTYSRNRIIETAIVTIFSSYQRPQLTISGTPGTNYSARTLRAIILLVYKCFVHVAADGSELCKWMLHVNQWFPAGSLGDVSECESDGSSEGLSSHQGNNKLPVRQSQTPLGVMEIRPHPSVTRSCSGPHDQRGQRPPTSLPQGSSSQSAAFSSESPAEKTRACASIKVGADGVSRPRCSGRLRETHMSRSTPSLFSHQPDAQTQQQQQQQQSPAPQAAGSADASGPGLQKRLGTPNWQTERWHIWNILSKDNADALPETLV